MRKSKAVEKRQKKIEDMRAEEVDSTPTPYTINPYVLVRLFGNAFGPIEIYYGTSFALTIFPSAGGSGRGARGAHLRGADHPGYEPLITPQVTSLSLPIRLRAPDYPPLQSEERTGYEPLIRNCILR